MRPLLLGAFVVLAVGLAAPSLTFGALHEDQTPKSQPSTGMAKPDRDGGKCGLRSWLDAARDGELSLRALVVEVADRLGNELVQRLRRRPETQRIIEFLEAGENDKILEIGCNTGYLLARFHKETGHGANFTGLDSRDSIVARSRAKRIPGATVVVGDGADGRRTDYADSSFTRVVAQHVLEHFDSPDGLLREIRRVLAPDGVAVIAVPKEAKHTKWHPGYWRSRLKRHKYFYPDVNELRRVLAKRGFDVRDSWETCRSMVVRAIKKPPGGRP